MLKLKFIVIATSLAGAATVANASSPDAWAELFAKSSAACAKASAFNGAKARGQGIDFQAVVLVIVDGRYAQPHMKNAPGTAYCLYDKQTGKTEISTATDAAAAVSGGTKADVAMGRTCWSESIRAKLKSPRPIGTACTAKTDEGDDYRGVVRR